MLKKLLFPVIFLTPAFCFAADLSTYREASGRYQFRFPATYNLVTKPCTAGEGSECGKIFEHADNTEFEVIETRIFSGDLKSVNARINLFPQNNDKWILKPPSIEVKTTRNGGTRGMYSVSTCVYRMEPMPEQFADCLRGLFSDGKTTVQITTAPRFLQGQALEDFAKSMVVNPK